jgi:hypothetical protein
MTKQEKPVWKLIVFKPDGEDVSYFYTHTEVQYPESIAQNAGFRTQVVNLTHQRDWMRLRTKELIDRIKSGMTTMQDGYMVEKFVYDHNDALPKEEKFLED